MKTSEFITKIKGMGYRPSTSGRHILIYIEGYRTPMYVNTKRLNRINSDNLDVPTELFDLCVEYARTPIEEREEEKKYYLKLPFQQENLFDYLNYNNDLKKYRFSNNEESIYYKTQFTQREIDNLPNQDFIKTLIKEEVK